MLRDEIIAYNQLHQCTGTMLGRVLIRTPIALIEQLNPTHKHLDLFDTTNYGDTSDYLYIRIFPDYDVENDRLGEPGLKNTSTATSFVTTTTRRGFKATIKDRRKLLLDLLSGLVDIARSSAYNRYSPIKVMDFCYPEPVGDANTSVIGGTLATARWGEIAIDSPLPSCVGISNDYYLKRDWGFTFKEVSLRK